MTRYTILVLILSILGCMVGPNYRRPDVDVPPSCRFTSADSSASINEDWWTLFNDE